MFAAGYDGWRTAFDLDAAGAHVKAVIDARVEPPPKLVARASNAGIRVLAGGKVLAARGWHRLAKVEARARS